MSRAALMTNAWLAAAALIFAASAQAAEPPRPQDWPTYGHDAGGARYSPLAQITPQNVASLKIAWTYHMDPTPNASGEGFKPFSTTTPLVVDGRMYLATPYHRVVALDPATGKELWVHELADRDQAALRGIAYWPGDQDHAPRIIVSTMKARIVALDAKTGASIADFGNNGIVETKTPEVMNGFPNGFYSYSAPPILYGNLAILGSKLQEYPGKGPAGDARAWDVITGKLVWTFHSVPRPGEAFNDTWEGDGWKQRSGVNMWNMPTVDTERGIAYLTFSAPSSDRYGADHKGANLFGDALVAVDAKTGKYLWHFQTTHHDVWDYDLATPPTLLTVMRDGKAIPAVVAMNKTALLFILNRETGEPLYPVEERPVPPSSVPTEKTWPTQPFPTKPGIITRMAFTMADLVAVTPDHTARCKAMIEKDGAVGSAIYEPLRADKPTVRFPGSAGGPEWGGGAFDPTLGLYIFNSNQLGNIEKLVPTDDGDMAVVSQRFRDQETRTPCQTPPWGELIAVNVNTGEVAWRSVLGVTDIFPVGKQATGRPSNAGPIITGGGLTFVGGTDDHRFRAFETRTGRELWTQVLDYSAHATPITYEGADGRQYVAIVATGGSYLSSPSGGDSLLVFALPK
jgi:quinoprotein glucose dehydrogenase